MSEDILREAIPDLKAYLRRPGPERLRTAMATLEAALTREADRSAPAPPFRSRLEAIKPGDRPVSLRRLLERPCGHDEHAAWFVQRILEVFRERGIQETETRVQREARERDEREAFGPPADFGHVFTSPSSEAAAAIAASPWRDETLPRMQAVAPPPSAAPTDLPEAYARWQPMSGDTVGFAACMFFTIQAVSEEMRLTRILLPVGVSPGWVRLWGSSYPRGTYEGIAWPDDTLQSRTVKQLLGCAVALEAANGPCTPAQVARWMRFAQRLLTVGDAEAMAAAVREHVPPWLGGDTYQPERFGQFAGGRSPPDDPIFLETVRRSFFAVLKSRLKDGNWPP